MEKIFNKEIGHEGDKLESKMLTQISKRRPMRSRRKEAEAETETEEEMKEKEMTTSNNMLLLLLLSPLQKACWCKTSQTATRRKPILHHHLQNTCYSLALVIVMLLSSGLATTTTLAQASYSSQPQANTMAGLQQSMAQLLQVFNGLAAANESNHLPPLQDVNHFKLMETDGDFLLVGARNVVYNLSLSTMREQRRLEWPSSQDDVSMCRMKGKSPDQCQNYIRVLKLQSPDTLVVCGTNAYRPRCRTYHIKSNAYELVNETPGEGVCPYQESQNVTSLFAEGKLYSATATQFSGIDGLIHRAPLRTEQFNPKQLNSPNFVSSFRYGEHVYFLFRETAVEHINCGKTIYSRIARVCINDSGGPSRGSRERWTSFVKARLNCSIPGEFPFYFDEVQASTGIISSSLAGANEQQGASEPGAGDLLYAVFTTPTNSIGGSAVCAFRMTDVLAAFDGPFKFQADPNSNWLPMPESRVPQPRPGTCVKDSKELPDEKINFIKDNPLMDTAVEAVWSQPLVMMASINFRFTQIAVDAQVEAQQAPGAPVMRTDVIFVGTDDGRVFKLINTHHLQPALAQLQQQQLAMPNYFAQRSPFGGGLQEPPLSAPFRANAAAQISAPGAAAAAAQAREPLADISGNTVIIEQLHMFDSRSPIVNLMVHYPSPYAIAEAGQRPKLIVLSSKQLKAIPLSRCERALSCTDCLALHDPYCGWDSRQMACLSIGRSAVANSQLHSSFAHQYPSARMPWFPPNNNQLASNFTFAWFSQCPAMQALDTQPPQVGAPYRSTFSSHLQVPIRFDYASGHHLSHTSLVSLAPPPSLQQQSANSPGGATSASLYSRHQQQPSSECLTFCGGVHQPMLQANEQQQQQLMMTCADYVQQYYSGTNQLPAWMDGPATGGGQVRSGNQFGSGNLYTSENLYLAVIICALSGLVLGLLFGFAVGRNTKKHDSSICSSTFDETNLYMASTGSHGHGANLFAAAAQQHQLNQRHLSHHPLLQQAPPLPPNGTNNLRTAGNQQPHLFDASQCLLNEATHQGSNYGNAQQHMLLHLATGQAGGNNGSKILDSRDGSHLTRQSNNSSIRSGNLPPIPQGNNATGHQKSPLVNTTSSTHIHHAQLTPNGHQQHHGPMSSGSASSTNTSSTSTTMPVNDHQHQLYLNQQQIVQHHQRTLSNGTDKSSSATTKLSNGVSGGKSSASILQQQHQQQQQQNNKIYL